ncbi:MAG: hypothetical protein IJV95_01955 [Clostridia bacterium]|nr:hypothetical protein [Clostridia bacterium]
MKKLLTLILSVILCFTAIIAVGCNEEPQAGKVNIKYYADGQVVVQSILGGSETIGLVPEPAATALTKNAAKQGKTIYRLDLQELYDGTEKAYPQAVLMVKKSVLGACPDVVSTLQNKITESATWIKTNAAAAVTAIGEHGNTTLQAGELTESAIDGCKIYWQSASDAKSSVKTYINKIVDIDATKATAVNDDFFYTSVTGGNAKNEYTFIMPDGAPALAVAKLISDGDDLGTSATVSYSVVAANQISPSLSSGTADFIVAPVNLASKFYKASGEDHYVMDAVLTHGNFYIMSTEKISLKSTAGKRVAVPNMGAVPDWTFKMVLNKHNLDFVTVE